MKKVGIAAICLIFLGSAASHAGSIWNKSGGTVRTLYADDTARAVGDNLTIIINEQTTIGNQTERKLEKNSGRSATGSGSASDTNPSTKTLNKILGVLNLQAKTETQSTFDGKSNYGDTRSLVDQVTVTVQDVLPNGNLVVVGKRERDVAGDQQIISVSGVVRPSDITFTNSISSQKVANFQITVKTKGTEAQTTSPGWLGRLLNFFNPS